MEDLAAQFVVISGLVYALLEFLKPVYDYENHKWNFDRVAAIVLGVTVSLLAKFDALALVNVRMGVPYVGNVLTGILAGGAVGAGLIHDLPPFIKALFGKPAA